MAHTNPSYGDPGNEWTVEINQALDDIDANADARVPKSTVTTQGDLIVGSGSGTVGRLAAANNNGFVLSTDLTGDGVARLKWVSPTANVTATDTTKIPLATVTSAGDLILATGNAAVTRLARGSTGQVLTAGASTISWVTPRANNRTFVQSGTPTGAITGDLWVTP